MMGGTLPMVIVRAIASLVVLFVLATIFLGLRIWARSTLSRTWRPAVDDFCLIMAWVFDNQSIPILVVRANISGRYSLLSNYVSGSLFLAPLPSQKYIPFQDTVFSVKLLEYFPTWLGHLAKHHLR